ncbi:hypothetical protein BKA61DRAFT_681369 [Leptodontidium sp. MPI-SDFR-AT-0119]|nr:hypothetical protein BKA61DRAFT_681369 [Leptodontidium sp. MPI-SDFR-AT-0119]
MVEGKKDTIQPVQLDETYGSVEKIDDAANREFYGGSQYQWELFVVTGFGWITENFWSQGIRTVQPLIKFEFSDITVISYTSVAYYVGLIVGAFFWRISADFIRLAFSCIWSVIGTAAGGNVPVDSLIFLEFVPGSHQWLLTALSAWLNFGQVIISLLGWVFQTNFSCAASSTWLARDRIAWDGAFLDQHCRLSLTDRRYLLITLGALTLAFAFIRIVVFKMPESPRYLLSKGRDAEAVDSVNFVARRYGKPEPLALDMLQDTDAQLGLAINYEEGRGLSPVEVMKDNFKDFKGVEYSKLFANKKLCLHTGLIWFI